MKTLFLIPFLVLSSFFCKTKETEVNKFTPSNHRLTNDTLVLPDTMTITLNVFYDEIPPYFNFDGDSTKRNIFNVRYHNSGLEIYHIIDYKTDFWSVNDSTMMQIIDTIEFYEYPVRK